MCLDGGNVVCHFFTAEEREVYNLEHHWGGDAGDAGWLAENDGAYRGLRDDDGK